jgi:hypothetical protein
MDYLDFDVRFELPAEADGPVAVVDAPAGQIRSPFSLRRSQFAPFLSVLGQSVRCSARDRGGALRHLCSMGDPGQPQQIGALLYRSLVVDRFQMLLEKSRGMAFARGGSGLRFRLRFDLQNPELAALATLPWELLYDERAGRFLFCGDRRTLLVRFLEVAEAAASLDTKAPFRLLAVLASPSDLPLLDLAEERRRIQRSLGGESQIELSFLEQARLLDLREEILRSRCDGLHFMGHGSFDPITGEGMLALLGDDGAQHPVSGSAMAELLGDLGLRLVVFNACQSGQMTGATGLDPFAGVAAALVRGGLPAIVAMQFPISDQAAIRFAEVFYRRIAAGDRIGTAVGEGRRALYEEDRNSLEWATPVLYMRAQDEPILPKETKGPSSLQRALDRLSGRGAPDEDGFLDRLAAKRLAGLPAGLWLVTTLNLVAQTVVWLYAWLLLPAPQTAWSNEGPAVTFVSLLAALLALRCERTSLREKRLPRRTVRWMAFLLGSAIALTARQLLR